MWIFLPLGFFSIVSAPPAEADELLVRSRERADLVALRKLLPELSRVLATPERDYPFRAIVRREYLATFLAEYIREDLRYGNFKAEVAKRQQGPARELAYHSVWAVLASAFRGARGRTR